MKKIKPTLLNFLLICVFALPLQSLFAVDVPLKKDETGPGTMINSPALRTSALKTQIVISVTADLIGSDLIVDFSTTVGTAFVSIVDLNGNIVYQTSVDTFSSPEVIIPVDGLNSGKYNLKIAYGSTNLIGDFKL